MYELKQVCASPCLLQLHCVLTCLSLYSSSPRATVEYQRQQAKELQRYFRAVKQEGIAERQKCALALLSCLLTSVMC